MRLPERLLRSLQRSPQRDRYLSGQRQRARRNPHRRPRQAQPERLLLRGQDALEGRMEADQGGSARRRRGQHAGGDRRRRPDERRGVQPAQLLRPPPRPRQQEHHDPQRREGPQPQGPAAAHRDLLPARGPGPDEEARRPRPALAGVPPRGHRPRLQGQPDAGLTEDPARKIGPTYSALEECRADAIALYQFLDPKVVEIGAVSAEEQVNVAKAMFLGTLTHQLRVNGELEGDVVREAHERAGQLILNYLIQPGQDSGVAVTNKDGKHFVQILDVKKAQAGVKEIVEKLQTLKSTGDAAGTATFFDQFGTTINKTWQTDVKARLEALAIPKDTAIVFPKLVPVLGDSELGKTAEGEEARKVLQDATLETGESFADQMLRFKRWAKSRELAPK